jgi:2-C-methyl-D-erythritol 4-phosphate cytidylyltransferase
LPRDVGVVVVAAGQGSRLGGSVPKQFREIAGVPLVLRALRPFLDHPEVAQVVLALPSDQVTAPPSWLAAMLGSKLTMVAGGAERRDSVAAGLVALRPECRFVLVHDGARPFVERTTIDAVLAKAREGWGAVPAVPLSDTLKETGPDADPIRVNRTLPRERLWRAQTPQGFPRAMLERAYAASAGDGLRVTDDAMLVERLGERVCVVPDSVRNFKVTTPEDLAFAELMASRPT